jgi:hypothetical protein
MRLRFVLRLSFGRSRTVPSGSTSDPFVAWRYRTADVQRADVQSRRFGNLEVYYRTDSMFGVPVFRLLDVLDASGQRRPEAIGPVVAGLPGPGAAVLHASDDDRIARSVAATVPRRWNMPVILKPLAAEKEVLRLLRETVFFAGDIDSA